MHILYEVSRCTAPMRIIVHLLLLLLLRDTVKLQQVEDSWPGS